MNKTFKVTLQNRISAETFTQTVVASSQHTAIVSVRHSCLSYRHNDWREDEVKAAKVLSAECSAIDDSEGVSEHLVSPFADIISELNQVGIALPSLETALREDSLRLRVTPEEVAGVESFAPSQEQAPIVLAKEMQVEIAGMEDW